MRKIIPILALCLLAFVACKTSQQRIVYNTLYTVEATVNTAHDAYLDQVVTGKVPTNDVPAVAKAYNTYHLALGPAISAAQFSWTNIAPADITKLANEVLNAIAKAKLNK